MTFKSRPQLASYEILAPVSAGGMSNGTPITHDTREIRSGLHGSQPDHLARVTLRRSPVSALLEESTTDEDEECPNDLQVSPSAR